jgi:pyrimidine operon attenuation protein/uracil phosphoribosyltransferase
MTLLSVFDTDDMRRVCTRISHEIIERNHGSENIVLVGLLRRGALFASRLAQQIQEIEGNEVPVYSLDITVARDDRRLVDPNANETRPADLSGYPDLLNEVNDVDFTTSRVILVDDVLFTGRSVRAAMEIVSSISRPDAVQLAVLIDRGHRELPIRADFIGKNVPTKRTGERVLVLLDEIDGIDRVDISREDQP